MILEFNIFAVLKTAGIVYLCIGAFVGLAAIGTAVVWGRDCVFDEHDPQPISPKEERKELLRVFFETTFLWGKKLFAK